MSTQPNNLASLFSSIVEKMDTNLLVNQYVLVRIMFDEEGNRSLEPIFGETAETLRGMLFSKKEGNACYEMHYHGEATKGNVIELVNVSSGKILRSNAGYMATLTYKGKRVSESFRIRTVIENGKYIAVQEPTKETPAPPVVIEPAKEIEPAK